MCSPANSNTHDKGSGIKFTKPSYRFIAKGCKCNHDRVSQWWLNKCLKEASRVTRLHSKELIYTKPTKKQGCFHRIQNNTLKEQEKKSAKGSKLSKSRCIHNCNCGQQVIKSYLPSQVTLGEAQTRKTHLRTETVNTF